MFWQFKNYFLLLNYYFSSKFLPVDGIRAHQYMGMHLREPVNVNECQHESRFRYMQVFGQSMEVGLNAHLGLYRAIELVIFVGTA